MDHACYVSKMEDMYEERFGSKPKQTCQIPIDSGDHLELDASEFLDEEGIEIYQSLIGSMQWPISIGKYGIHTAAMTMSSFCIQPQVRHLERLERMFGYLCKFCHYKIRF